MIFNSSEVAVYRSSISVRSIGALAKVIAGKAFKFDKEILIAAKPPTTA